MSPPPLRRTVAAESLWGSGVPRCTAAVDGAMEVVRRAAVVHGAAPAASFAARGRATGRRAKRASRLSLLLFVWPCHGGEKIVTEGTQCRWRISVQWQHPGNSLHLSTTRPHVAAHLLLMDRIVICNASSKSNSKSLAKILAILRVLQDL
jgi:hypothetical protein